MSRQILLFGALCLLGYFAVGQSGTAVLAFNPTGTYKLDSKTYVRNGETYGYYGTIKAKLLKPGKIVLHLYVCKGAPSYNEGTLLDTLICHGNHAVYRNTTDGDSTCRINFYFTGKGVTVEQIQTNLNSGCGFGFAVFPDGYYKKTSRKVPLIEQDY